MGTPVSALGAAASGASGLIDSVANLLPTTTTASGHTTTSASASSNTQEGSLGVNSGSTTTKGTKTDVGLLSGITSELGGTGQTSSTTGAATENFSGQSNTTQTQTMLTDQGVMRIVNMMLQGNGGVPGLAETVSGERAGNLYNSSTNSLLTSNLVSTIGGEVARLSAPTVQSQDLGATQTQTSNTTSSLMDAVTRALTNQNQTTKNEGTSTSQEDVLSMVMSLAQQLTDQTSQSETNNKTKTKTKKFPSYICTWLESVLPAGQIKEDFEALVNFKSEYLIPYQPRLLIGYDIIGPMIVTKLEELTAELQLEEALRIQTQFIVPAAEKFNQQNNLGALFIYTEMVLSLHDKYIRGV